MSVKYGEIATVGKVKAEIRERVAVVTLADPPGNGVGLQVTNRILELLDEYEQNETVRCVLFTHEGDDFSKSGAGAEEFTLIDQGKSMVEVSGTFRPSGLKVVERIDTYPKPTIAVGKGLCLGAAYSLFSCCDIRIAGSSLRLYIAVLVGRRGEHRAAEGARRPVVREVGIYLEPAVPIAGKIPFEEIAIAVDRGDDLSHLAVLGQRRRAAGWSAVILSRVVGRGCKRRVHRAEKL